MARKLKVWNGRGYCCRNADDPRWRGINHSESVHANVCAHSRADARRVIAEYAGYDPRDTEIRDYWSECWGSSMEGIEPERGLWLEFERGKPVRVV